MSYIDKIRKDLKGKIAYWERKILFAQKRIEAINRDLDEIERGIETEFPKGGKQRAPADTEALLRSLLEEYFNNAQD